MKKKIFTLLSLVLMFSFVTFATAGEKKVNIISEKLVFDKFFKIVEGKFIVSKYNNTMSKEVTRLSFKSSDSVGVLIKAKDSDSFLFAEQFRYPAYNANEKDSGWLTEIMAGRIEHNEDPAETAKRESIEETGYEIDHLEPITTFFVSPGGATEKIHLYYAEVDDFSKVGEGGGLASEAEDIKVIKYSFNEIWKLYKEGKITDGKTIIALQWYKINKMK